MEEIYRRRRKTAGGRREKRDIRSERSYKHTVLQQALVCICIFIAVLWLKISEKEELFFARQSVCYILTHQTDCRQLAEKSKQWLQEKINRKTEEEDGTETLANLQLPMDSAICSAFGKRTEAESGKEEFHYGVDFSGELGDKIKCVSDGTAEEIGSNEEYGNYILIRHGERYCSFYANCETVLPIRGDMVKAGQVIATLGNGGSEAEPCLHFEIREGEVSLDPAVFLNLESETQQ